MSQKGNFLRHSSFSLLAQTYTYVEMRPALVQCTLEDIELSLGLA